MKNKKGFTLLELVIIISIILIMSSIINASLSSLRSNASLKAAQGEVVSGIKLTQNYSLQGRIESGVTVCGYGIHFTDNQNYEIFYNKLDTTVPFSDCEEQNANANYRHNDSFFSTDIESYSLPDGITLGDPVVFSQAELFFTIPHANVYNSSGTDFVGDTWRMDSADNNRDIIINSRGLIDEN